MMSDELQALSLPGGDDGIRTHDPLLAGQVLSQLSYTPVFLYPSSWLVMSVFQSSLKIEQQLTWLLVSAAWIPLDDSP